MKSLLQEGSSIIKAVEAAWIKVGMPAEFSVKVMRDAEKSFFGLATKNSAVISLCYDGVRPEKRQNGNGVKQYNNKEDAKRTFNHEEILEKVMRDTKELQAKSNVFGDDLVTDAPFSKQQEKKKEKTSGVLQKNRPEKLIQKKTEKSQVVSTSQLVTLDQNDQKESEKRVQNETQEQLLQQWSQSMTDVVTQFLGEIFAIMQLDIQLTYKIEGLQLQVTLSKPVFEDADQEYKLYTSLAFLMIQKIKKEFRKKCKGYRVVFQNAAQALSFESKESL